MITKKVSIDTACVQTNKDNKSTESHILPLYASSSFIFENAEQGIDIFTGKATGHVYSRYGNPTIDTVAQKIADLEVYDLGIDAYGFMTSSGMSAISTILYALLSSGDKVITQGNLYGGTTELLSNTMSRHGISPIFCDFSNLDIVETIICENKEIKLIYLETPSNPTLAIVDLQKLSTLAKKYNLLTVIDNTFCTPLIQQPFKFGIDFIIHSTTKYLNGHGNSIAGAIVSTNFELRPAIFKTLKLIGSTCNAWDAWLTYTGMKTLSLRIQKHSENALYIAEKLSTHKKVTRVNYNGLTSNSFHQLAKKQMKAFGGMMSIEIIGGQDNALKFMNNLKLCVQAPTLGDVDTLVLHPATSSHLNVDKALREENGITDGLVRFSIGIEDKDDILNDILQSLDKIQ